MTVGEIMSQASQNLADWCHALHFGYWVATAMVIGVFVWAAWMDSRS